MDGATASSQGKHQLVIKGSQEKDVICSWGNDSAQETMLSTFWGLTPVPPTLVSAHTAQVHSICSLLEPKMSGYIWNCALALWEVVCISRFLFLVHRNFATFYGQILCRYLSQFWSSWLRSPACCLDPECTMRTLHS